MFLQIRLDPEDKDVSRFFWRSMKEGAKNVKRNMYFDDIVLFCENKENAICRIKKLRKLMEIEGFDVTKSSHEVNEVVYATSRIYDPLGYLTPFIVRAKTLIQELWQRGLHWKDPLPDDLKTTWTRWITEWKKIRNVRTPRCLIEIPTKNIIRLELHGFSDASERAYGGAVYIKMIDAEGKGAIKLIVAKSKIAPLKSVTLPRLKLVAALVTAKLISHVKRHELGNHS
ncbi:hypothetical protein T4D_13744 [Trichinella pseudospiralis]|uniref:Reverse transcriptase domain-containing protein n=1 Tax=Trichinella pseudospiralis TaxID=6337 RepID=A0A0V1G0G3_TRIPS|nr:hypothetical protein T4D_13744 [Trichinella pseudospiralis]